MRLYFEKQLPCEPTQAWLFVTDPRRVNLWSAIKVYTELNGDGGNSWGVGAMRRLEVEWNRKPLFELVSISQPGRSFVSRVMQENMGLGANLSIEIQSSGKGSLVSWDFQPLESFVTNKRTFQKLQQSFQENVVRSVCSFSDAIESNIFINPDVDADQAARSEALSTLENLYETQRDRVERMLRVADIKVSLAWLISRTTERVLGALHQSEIKHPRWIAEFVTKVDRFFETALQEHYTSATKVSESHWQEVFRAMDRNDRTLDNNHNAALDAWLHEDVPRALALTFLTHYRDLCDFARFRTDYFAFVNAMLEAAQETRHVFTGKRQYGHDHSVAELKKLLPSANVNASRFLQRFPIAQWNAIYDRGARMVQLVEGQVLFGSRTVTSYSGVRMLPGARSAS